MRLSPLTLPVSLGLLIMACQPAGAAVELKMKFASGDVIESKITQDMTSTATVMGNEVKTRMQQTMFMQTSVESVAPDGAATVTQKVTRVDATMQLPNGQTYKYDSQAESNENPPPGYPDVMDALVGAEFQMKIAPTGKISDIKVPQTLVEKFKNLPGAQALGAMASEEGLKQMMSQSSFVLPEKPVEKGATWDSSTDLEMPFGTIHAQQTYTYQGTASGGNEEIGVELKMTMEPKEGSPFKMSLKETDSDGKILFDNEAGRLVKSEITQKMVMEMGVQGQTFDQSVTQKITMETLE
jgi:hypothetical protein